MTDLDKTEEIANSGRPFVSEWSKSTVLALIAEVRALRQFHGFFADRCEGLFMQFGMPAVDAYNAAARGAK